MSNEKLEMKPINPPERKRTYHFPNGKIELTDVNALLIRPSRTHRLLTADG